MTSRISRVDPAVAQGRSFELLSAVKGKIGMVPNGVRTEVVGDTSVTTLTNNLNQVAKTDIIFPRVLAKF